MVAVLARDSGVAFPRIVRSGEIGTKSARLSCGVYPALLGKTNLTSHSFNVKNVETNMLHNNLQ